MSCVPFMCMRESPSQVWLAFSAPLACPSGLLQCNRSSLSTHGSMFFTLYTKPDFRVCIRKWEVINRNSTACTAPQKQVTTSSKPKYIRRTGLNTPVVLSKELGSFIGEGDISNRARVLSYLSKYLRENNLYVGGEKKRVSFDEQLSSLFQVTGEVSFKDFFRLMKPHLTDPSVMGPEYEARAKKFFEQYLEQRGARASWDAPQRGLDPRGMNSFVAQKKLRRKRQGMFAEAYLEPCLRPICNGKTYLSRPDALKAVWAYIKNHDLQDAQNGRRIRVSETLRDALRLPDVEWIDSFKLGSYVFKLLSKREK
eukprot:gb/GEZJ01003047.1/.p1 GENE.gb/GEZJ01003047.1/~~gb/GEZJ01003047.1/.p1  ORF type:complete len:311 (-),score=37.32 gb/GEZJ01003047.1/:479-1411(-)